MSFLLPPLPPTFEAALRDVRAQAVAARIAAAERLAEPEAAQRAAALAGLLELAEDRDARVRAAAVRALQVLGDRSAVSALVNRIEDVDALVRELAVVALGALRGEQACEALRAALRSRHPEVRFQAVASYVEACEAPRLSALKPLLRDEDAKVRANAARSLTRFGDEARAELERSQRDSAPPVRAEAALAIARLGEAPDAAALRPALSDPDLLPDALEAVARFEVRELLDDVGALALSSRRPLPIKAAAARTLLSLGDARGVAVLRAVMRAFRSDGRSLAVQIAGELRVRELVPELLRLSRFLRGTDPEALVAALEALLPLEPSAGRGLTRLARRDDEAGDRARRALARAPSAAGER